MPGGPNSSTPFGILAPICRNLAGASRKSRISLSSSIASSRPATSLNVTFGWSFETGLARDLPKFITRLPPPCIWFRKNSTTRMMTTKGSRLRRMPTQGLSFWLSTEKSLTLAFTICFVIVSV